MIEKIIDLSLRNRFLVLLGTVFVIGWGIFALGETPLDAIPDLSDVQVIVMTNYPGQSPQTVEDQVTYPLTSQMLSVPHAKTVRGYSFFGISFVYVIFEDGTDIYWARSRVLESLNYVSGRLPDGVSSSLGPDATGVGWVFEYVVDGEGYDLAQLRSVQDWYIRYALTAVPGVAEVASVGGFVRQYQVVVDPNKLAAYNIPLMRLRTAIMRSNNDVGGRVLEMSETEYMVRAPGYIRGLDDLKQVSVGVGKGGTPVLLRDVATVQYGPELRRGLAEWNGDGEIVGGIVVMRYGENALEVIERVQQKLKEIQPGLPPGVTITTAYDRSGLIHRAIDNLREKLFEEFLAVAVICILFLLHVRSSLVIIVTLPVAVLMSFIVMSQMGVNANIMSLGGIAIAVGAMVDGAIVMIENAHKHLERDRGKKPHMEIIRNAAREVGPSIFYSLLIITLSFLPVFTLEAQEGRLFKPLAYTKTFAMAGAAALAITLVPVLMGYLVRGKIRAEKDNIVNRMLIGVYRPVINGVLRWKWITIIIALLILGGTWLPFSRLGSEFMPPLYEGDLLYMPTTLPGISVTKARELLQQTDQIIATFPEVHHVFGKIGRAETATDPAPLTMIETTIMLKPQEIYRARWYSSWMPDVLKPLFHIAWPEQQRNPEWREGMTPDKLIDEMDQAIQFPGLTNAWTMPIKTRIDMLSTGIKTPIGIKVVGPDLEVLEQLGAEVESAVRQAPGTVSVYAERVMGGNYFEFVVNRQAAARYGLTVGDVQDVIMSAVGGMNITTTVEGLERYPVNLRYGRELRDNMPALRRVLIPTPRGEQVPLAQVADIVIKKGPPGIKSENAMPNAWVYVDIRDIDVGTYVRQAKQIVTEKVQLPPGYFLVWSGQYEYMQRAQARLQVVVPVTLIIILVLLYLNFKNLTDSLIVMLSLPFALVGGIWFMYVQDYNLSVAVWVGFIALAGVAAETGIVMILYLDHAWRDVRLNIQGRPAYQDLIRAIQIGAVERVRPKMMTVMTTIIGLLPIMYGHGAGSEVMKRIATPMVGGMISSTALTLIVIPAIYLVVKGWNVPKNAAKES
jgi:copper/silver efflux system protein